MTTRDPLRKSAAVMLERKGRKEKAAIWKEASERLLTTSSRRVEVNLGHFQGSFRRPRLSLSRARSWVRDS